MTKIDLAKGLALGWLAYLLAASQLWAQSKPTEAIKLALEQQMAAWNEGNIEKFMDWYWRSDQMKFVSSSGVRYGWQATLDRYRKTYPGKEGMGKLRFEIVNSDQIDKKTCFVVGKFFLERQGANGQPEQLSGWFTLVWQKIGGRWLIVSDHTS
jgi:ketosteroid isomerase-like protein